MKRRQFLRRGLTALAVTGFGSAGINLLDSSRFSGSALAAQSRNIPLPIPPLLDAKINDGLLGLTVQEGSRTFFPGLNTPTLGYNGDFLGPTLRVRNGERIRLQIQNNLKESTTVHWHGLHVPARWDGGPRQVIEAGAVWRPDFHIKQEAATLWYHPHALGRTGEHVYRGLAGLFIIEDDLSDKLPIPRDYGVDDIPLVFQDRRFYEDGRFAHVTSGHDIMHGVVGNHVLVNGVIEPGLAVPQGVVRFRMLNGSNSSIYRISFGDERQFRVIASDGGFLEKPVKLSSLVFSAGERYEILADFSKDKAGFSTPLILEQWGGNEFRAVEIRVGQEKGNITTSPEELRSLELIDPESAAKTRSFAMQTVSQGGRLTINGSHMDINRIDETVTLGSTEIWEISNNSGRMMQLPHSMHLHDVQFQILDRNGALPPPIERGRKDTVLLMPGETVRVISRFEDYTGVYMYHCHMLEHEDNGMMGQFEVVEAG